MLGRRAAIGGIMMVAARFITRLFDLATMLVLARILQPKDFGLVAIAMTLVSITDAATELPLNQALVRLPAISRQHFDTAFTLAALRGLALTVILCAMAVPFARFYDDGRLVNLILILSLAPTARALVNPTLAEYQKRLSFWRDFVLELGGKAAGFAAGISCALMMHSYWAIAAATIAVQVVNCAGSYALAPYRPGLTFSQLRVFSGFIGWMSAAQIVSAFNWQFERLLMGRLNSKAALGLFTTASDIATVPFLALFGPLMRPLLAAFSQLRVRDGAMAASYQRASAAVFAIGLPLLVGESLVAEQAIRFVLGPKWLSAAPLLRWLALSAVPAVLAMPALPLIVALGDTRLVAKRNALELAVKLPIALVGGIFYGFYGVIVARLLSELAADLFIMRAVKRLLGLTLHEQLTVSWRSAAAAATMALAVAGCGREGVFDGVSGSPFLALAAPSCLGAAVYAAALVSLWQIAGRPPGLETMALQAITRTKSNDEAPGRRGTHALP